MKAAVATNGSSAASPTVSVVRSKPSKRRILTVFVVLLSIGAIAFLSEASSSATDIQAWIQSATRTELRRAAKGNQEQEGQQEDNEEVSTSSPPEQRQDDDMYLDKLEYFFMHLPKGGGNFAIKQLGILLKRAPEYKAYLKKNNGAGMLACNEGTQKLWHNFTKKRGNDTCTLSGSELGYQADAEHSYTILRDPLSHTLSQYFHCAESKDHASRAHLMPSLDEWLQSWVNARNNQTQLNLNRAFKCYNPLDTETRFVEYNSTASPANAKADLKKRIDVLGSMDFMDLSLCTIVIQWTNGWIPKPCDCSDGYEQHQQQNRKRRRRLAANSLVYNATTDSHGVQHHGASFATTPEQERLILEELRPTDVKLYQLAKDIFWEQVQDTQRKYNVTICQKFRVNDK